MHDPNKNTPTCSSDLFIFQTAMMSDICRKLDFAECYITAALWKIVAPLLLVVGIAGNLLSIAVLSRQRMRRTATSVYLRLLAIVDSSVLLVNIPRQVTYWHTTVKLRDINTVACKTVMFLAPAIITMSWWLLPIISIDRLILVRYPIWAKTNCTKKLAGVVFSVLVLGTMAAHFHSVIFMEIAIKEQTIVGNITNTTIQVYGKCGPVLEWYREFQQKAWPMIILIVFDLAPVGCQVICNVLLVRELVIRSNKKAANQRVQQENGDKDQRDIRSVTRMLIVVCIFFVLSSVPQCLKLLLKPYIFKPKSPHDAAKELLLVACVQLLIYSSNGFNFLLYTLSGKVFREELWSMCEQGRRRFKHCFDRNAVYPGEI